MERRVCKAGEEAWGWGGEGAFDERSLAPRREIGFLRTLQAEMFFLPLFLFFFFFLKVGLVWTTLSPSIGGFCLRLESPRWVLWRECAPSLPPAHKTALFHNKHDEGVQHFLI